MYRNVYYDYKNRAIRLFTWDKQGNRVDYDVPFQPYLYIENSKSNDGVSIFDTKLVKRNFKTQFERKRFVDTSGIKRIFYNLSAEQQFLVDRFKDDNLKPEFKANDLRIFYLDIEVYSKFEFPTAKDANHPINLITIYDSMVGKYITWGLQSNFTNAHLRDDLDYRVFHDEKSLLQNFVKYWSSNYPDVVTGWNCLNLNEHVWYKDRINKLSKVSKNDHLFSSEIVNIYKETGMKKEYCIETKLGNKIYSSIDHKFPIYYKQPSQYKNANTLPKTVKDMRVSEMLNCTDDMYVKVEKRVNSNIDVTYRDLLLDNLDVIYNDKVEIIIDSVTVRDKVKSLGLCDGLDPKYYQGTKFWKANPSFWSCRNIRSIYPEFSVADYIANNDTIIFKRNNGHPFSLNTTEVVSNDMFRYLGFIFTDGGISDNKGVFNTFGYSSKYENVSTYYNNIVSNITGKTYTSPRIGKADNIYYKKHNINNIIGLLSPIIYDNHDKHLNVELLSRLSYTQFLEFYAGLLDGDGCIDKNGVCLSNFDYDYHSNLHNLQELLLWNNVQSTVHKNIIRISCSDYNEHFLRSLNLQHEPRQLKLDKLRTIETKNAISNNIKFFEYDDYMLVKIDTIIETGNIVPMADIETSTHYFTCNGIKTHNCDAFDITYIVNRLRKLFSDNYPDKLSPVGNMYSYEKLDRFKQPITVWNIGGVSCMDYLKVYKKFSRNERESYKLDYIGEYELNEGKIPFDGNLADLADNDWNKFVKYNIQDVALLVKLEQKLKYLQIARDLAYMGCAKIEKTLETNSVVAGAFAIEAHERGQIIPTFEYGSGERYAGGMVRDPVPGFRSDVISYDASSLYPNIMITLNLSPETKIGKYEIIDDEHVMVYVHGGNAYKMTKVNLGKYMKANNVVRSANNVLFNQNVKGIIPTIIDRIYQSRKTIKGDGLALEAKLKRGELSGIELDNAQRIIDDADTMQYSLKIFINSIYGTFGNQYSALYDIDLASATTITGQESNIQAGLSANRFIKDEYGIDTDVIIYGDTDSIYITLEDVYKHLGITLQDEKGFITKEAMHVIEQLGGEANPENGIITKDLMNWGVNTLNSADCRFEFKREKICNSAIFLNGKKQYMLYALDNEGVPYLDENGTPKAKLSITGGELISSKHSKKIRDMVIEVVKVIMDTKDPIIASTKFSEVYEAYKLLTPDELAVRQAIKTYKKYEHLANGLQLKKGIPPGSKASYIYNGIIDKLELGGKYQKIQDGDKIKRLYVAKNRFGVEYLAFLDKLPEEFGLEPNYKLLFDKNINPIMERIFTSVGWGHVTPTKQFTVNLLDMM